MEDVDGRPAAILGSHRSDVKIEQRAVGQDHGAHEDREAGPDIVEAEERDNAVGHADRQGQEEKGHDFVGPAIAPSNKEQQHRLDQSMDRSGQVDIAEKFYPEIHMLARVNPIDRESVFGGACPRAMFRIGFPDTPL